MMGLDWNEAWAKLTKAVLAHNAITTTAGAAPLVWLRPYM